MPPAHLVSAPPGERRWDSSVEPATSVNRIATFSMVTGARPPPARFYRRPPEFSPPVPQHDGFPDRVSANVGMKCHTRVRRKIGMN